MAHAEVWRHEKVDPEAPGEVGGLLCESVVTYSPQLVICGIIMY